ncbi:hypothetical protein F2Q69_00006964 [Brassica cretica]|uniref:Uncharacterized protein n=1 Tax=Brassica cretica TaxID=69181 RepID=A0A8S9NTX7_BRACR|nr:hypothetical protein F2Q69_00006964 [Brassica cretica]
MEKGKGAGELALRQGSRKKLLKPSIITAGSNKMRAANALVSPRRKAAAKGPRWPRKSNRRMYTECISKRYCRHPSDSQWSRKFVRVHERNIPEYQQKDTKEFYDVAGGIDKSFKLRRAFDSHGTRKFYWEEKDQYGVYRYEQGYARDLDRNTIRLHNMDIRRVLERTSRDEPSYICLPEHGNFFTQTKMVQEIYTKDKINEMFYGVCGEQEKNKEAFQMKLDGVYYPLNDSISWLTTFMEEMKQDIARIQHATDVARSSSIDRDQHTSIIGRRRYKPRPASTIDDIRHVQHTLPCRGDLN